MSATAKDYYAILELSRQASLDEVKNSYRRLARRYHPDHSAIADKSRAEEKFKEINEAHACLKDPKKRRQYDNLHPQWKQQVLKRERADGSIGPAGPVPSGNAHRRSGLRPVGPVSPLGGGGLFDWFEHLFHGGGDLYEPHEPVVGRAEAEDISSDIEISPREASLGTVLLITIKKKDPQVGGMVSRQFEVPIPAGIREGECLRVPGRGHRDSGTGLTGDLYLRVHISTRTS